MPRKKKKRICAHCGAILVREIKRTKKDESLFCSVDHAIEYYQEEKPEKEKKKSLPSQQTRLMAVKDIKRINPNWYNDPLYVYIGHKVRFHPMRQSIFHNSYHVQKVGRKKAIDKFESQFYRKVQSDSAFKQAVEGLRGKILVCWCSPSTCHGDVIINYLHKPKTLEDYQKKEKEVPQDVDYSKTDLVFNLIRLYEVQQDQFTYQDRMVGVEGINSRYIMPDYLVKQLGWTNGEVEGCLLSLNTLQNKLYWDGSMYIESKDHYIQRNHTDYKGRVKITRQNQMKLYRLFGVRPLEVSDREIIRSR